MSREPFYLFEQTDFSLRFARCANGEHPLRIDELKEVSAEEAATLIATLPSNATIVYASRPKSRALHLATADEAKRHSGINGVRKFAELSLSSKGPLHWIAAVTARNGGVPSDTPWLVATSLDTQASAIAELEAVKPKSLQTISATLATAGALASTTGKAILLVEIGELASHAMLVGTEGVMAAGAISLDLSKIGEAVQTELNLKFRGSAIKLFFNADYDFTDTGPKIAARVAESIKADLGRFLVDRPAPTELFVSGLPATQQWFGPQLATALGLANHAPDLTQWSAARGVSFARPELTSSLSSTWIGLLHVLHDHTLATAPATPPWHTEWVSTVAALTPSPAPAPTASVAAPVLPEKTVPSANPSESKPVSTAATSAPQPTILPTKVPQKTAPVATPASKSPPASSQPSIIAPPAAPKSLSPDRALTASTAVTDIKPTKSLIAAATAKAPTVPAKSAPSSVSYSTKPAPTPIPAPQSVVAPKPAEPVAATVSTPPPPRSTPPPEIFHSPRKKRGQPLLIIGLIVACIAVAGYSYFSSQNDVAEELAIVKQQAEKRLKTEEEKTRLAELKAEEEAEARRKLEAEFSQRLVDSEIARQQAESKALAESTARLANARGALMIATNPAGATVTVGDLPPRITPATFTDIRIGSYPITISLPRHETVKLDLAVAENATTESGIIPLVALIGSLQIESSPADASFQLRPANPLMIAPEAQRSGNTPVVLDDLSPGDYRVTLSRDGWAPHTEIVSIARGETTRLRWTWPNAVVNVTSTPSGATVMHAGKALGSTPLTLSDQSPGETSYEVLLDRYDPLQLNTIIEGGKILELAVDFKPENRIFTVDEIDRKPDPTGAKQPELPYYLTLENGRAEIQLIVNRNGTIRDLSVVHASHPDLGKYCLEAVEKWQFKTGLKDGVPVNVMIRVPFTFKAKG